MPDKQQSQTTFSSTFPALYRHRGLRNDKGYFDFHSHSALHEKNGAMGPALSAVQGDSEKPPCNLTHDTIIA
jgi:hypothetical protein